MVEKFFIVKGIVIFFLGDLGIGKIFCVEILIGELGWLFYWVYIFSVVSLYVGEMEKNVLCLFELVCAQDVILLFDEVDSLFVGWMSVELFIDCFVNMEVN